MDKDDKIINEGGVEVKPSINYIPYWGSKIEKPSMDLSGHTYRISHEEVVDRLNENRRRYGDFRE